MNEPRPAIESEPRIWLDRLAADELSSPERRELFAWLDRAPARWRECAMLLLEARELELALGDWTGDVPSGGELMVARSEKSLHLRNIRTRWLASIACLVLAFGSGVALESLRGRPDPAIVDGHQQQRTQAVPSSDAAEEPEPVVPTEPAQTARREPSDEKPLVADTRPHGGPIATVSPYVRSKWERQGFRVEQQGMVSLALPDGRNVKVPAEKLRYVGRRSI